MRNFASGIFAALSFVAAAAAEPLILPLWEGPAPGWNTPTYAEERSVSPDGTVSIRNVTVPTLEVFLPPTDKSVGIGIIVAPGGGLTSLAYGKEGTNIAEWLNDNGIAAFVLKYRIAHTDGEPPRDQDALWRLRRATMPIAIADGEQAMRLVRRHAAAWGAKRIGVIGFSAGGYPTLALALASDARLRPDFTVEAYPAVPSALRVPADAPPLFLVVADDDRFGTDTSLRLYQAWHAAKVPVEMHIYARGNHGFALRKSGIPTDTWNDRLLEWMAEMGFTAKRK